MSTCHPVPADRAWCVLILNLPVKFITMTAKRISQGSLFQDHNKTNKKLLLAIFASCGSIFSLSFNHQSQCVPHFVICNLSPLT